MSDAEADRRALEAARAKIKRLETALGFYCNLENWRPVSGNDIAAIADDEGQVARTALEERG